MWVCLISTLSYGCGNRRHVSIQSNFLNHSLLQKEICMTIRNELIVTKQIS